MHDTSMNPTALISVKVTIKRARIERVMNDQDKQRTGLVNLNSGQLRALNEWLDENTVLAPGPPTEHG
jgi:hypothetical protein